MSKLFTNKQIDPSKFEFEITENILIDDFKKDFIENNFDEIS